jgi:hypothetical protein
VISRVERNLFFATAAGCSVSALSLTSFAFFGLQTHPFIQHVRYIGLKDCRQICDLTKICRIDCNIDWELTSCLFIGISATALSALALYASVKFTCQLRSHMIKSGDQPISKAQMSNQYHFSQ